MRSFNFLLLSMLAGGAAAAEFKAVDLPPFTIALPEGDIKKQSPTVGAGVLVMELGDEDLEALGDKPDASKRLPPGSREIHVQWDPAVMSTDDDFKMMLTAVTRALPIKGARVLREKKLPSGLRVYALGSEEMPLALALTNCGSHVGVTVTMVFTRDIDLLMNAAERITGSVACKPEATLPPAAQVAYRLPKNFGVKHTDGIDILMSSEGEIMIAGVIPQDIREYPDMIRTLLGSIFSQALGLAADGVTMERLPSPKNLPPGEAPHNLVLHTAGDLDGARVSIRYCKAQDLSMFIMWYSVEAELQKSEERFDQVGCPGETGQPPPDLAEMFAAECKAGNDFACNMGKEVGNL